MKTHTHCAAVILIYQCLLLYERIDVRIILADCAAAATNLYRGGLNILSWPRPRPREWSHNETVNPRIARSSFERNEIIFKRSDSCILDTLARGFKDNFHSLVPFFFLFIYFFFVYTEKSLLIGQ